MSFNFKYYIKMIYVFEYIDDVGGLLLVGNGFWFIFIWLYWDVLWFFVFFCELLGLIRKKYILYMFLWIKFFFIGFSRILFGGRLLNIFLRG